MSLKKLKFALGRVENIEENGENAGYQNFLLFKKYFEKAFISQGHKKTYPFPKQALVFTCLQYKSFENAVGKGEIAPNEQLLLFPQCFPPVWKTFFHFH